MVDYIKRKVLNITSVIYMISSVLCFNNNKMSITELMKNLPAISL